MFVQYYFPSTSTSGTTPTESTRIEPIVEEEEDIALVSLESTQFQTSKLLMSKFQTCILDHLPLTKWRDMFQEFKPWLCNGSPKRRNTKKRYTPQFYI